MKVFHVLKRQFRVKLSEERLFKWVNISLHKRIKFLPFAELIIVMLALSSQIIQNAD